MAAANYATMHIGKYLGKLIHVFACRQDHDAPKNLSLYDNFFVLVRIISNGYSSHTRC